MTEPRVGCICGGDLLVVEGDDPFVFASHAEASEVIRAFLARRGGPSDEATIRGWLKLRRQIYVLLILAGLVERGEVYASGTDTQGETLWMRNE
jgi:hypothetical protein